MTDSTAPPADSHPRDRYDFRVPAPVATAVHVWADPLGISDNAGWCLLIRAGLIHALADPNWIPPGIAWRDRTTGTVKRKVTMPIVLAELLEAWATDREIARDVAAAALISSTLLDADVIGLPWLKRLPDTLQPRTAKDS